jgi:superfamily II DNA or RNA helicase
MQCDLNRRFFTRQEKRLMLQRQGYRCGICSIPIIERDAEADHIIPFSKGGPTSMDNGQALCISCNSRKSNTMPSQPILLDHLPDNFIPRGWQTDALMRFQSYLESIADKTAIPHGFAGSIVQGAGKSVLNGSISLAMHNAGLIDWSFILVPSTNLVEQTIKDVKTVVGAELTTERAGQDLLFIKSKGRYIGEVMTYSYLYTNQDKYKAIFKGKGERLLVIRDEVHQLADPREMDSNAQAWGAAVKDCFSHCRYRVSLSGTLFRSDKNIVHDIPYKTMEDGSLVSDPHFIYSMGQAINDGVIRRLKFHTVDADVRWMEAEAEDVQVARLSDDALSQKDRSKAIRVATNPKLEFARDLWRKANRNLVADRRGFGPGSNSAGVVLVKDNPAGLAMQDFIEKETGVRPPFVFSDGTDGPNKVLEDFKEDGSEHHWLVAIRKIGQGFSMKRLRHVVILSNIKTRNWFCQAACRANRLDEAAGEWVGFCGHVYIPALPEFVSFALEIEKEIAHVVADLPDDITPGSGGNGGNGGGGGQGDPFSHLDSTVTGETVIIHGIEYPKDLIDEAEGIKARHPDPSITVEQIAEVLRQTRGGQASGHAGTRTVVEPWNNSDLPLVTRIKSARAETYKLATALASLSYKQIPEARGKNMVQIIFSAASKAGLVSNDSDDLPGLIKKIAWLKNTSARIKELKADPYVCSQPAGVAA